MELECDTRELLEFRQRLLKQQISGALNLLEGFIYKSPCMRGYHLVQRSGGKRLQRYVRKRLLSQTRAMLQNRQRVAQLLGELSEVNWQLLQLLPRR
jgi:hypothetical protein